MPEMPIPQDYNRFVGPQPEESELTSEESI